jgi:hypothetical protein
MTYRRESRRMPDAATSEPLTGYVKEAWPHAQEANEPTGGGRPLRFCKTSKARERTQDATTDGLLL